MANVKHPRRMHTVVLDDVPLPLEHMQVRKEGARNGEHLLTPRPSSVR